MSGTRELLLQNSRYVGASLALLLLAAPIALSLFLRLAGLLMSSKSLAIAEPAQAAFRRRVWRWAIVFMFIGTLLHGAGLLLATQRQVKLDELMRSSLAQLRTRDWLALGVVLVKLLVVVLLAMGSSRLLRTILHYGRERLLNSQVFSSRGEEIAKLLEQLRLLLSTAILFGTAFVCARLLDLPEAVQRLLWIVTYLGTAFYFGRFAVGAAHLAIDVLFDLSQVLSRLESPLRYLGRFRHLSKLSKRATDYFILVGLATWTLGQISPGTWTVQTGRLALRIIAIFYLSRVLIEVCALFLNEFFLTRNEQNPAEFQQRQTLVPVAASLLRYGIYFTAVVMSLREAGIDPTPLLAGAGVAGVAVGLGAQQFVGDIVAGFFVLFESLFLVGDFVEVAGVKGNIEEIGVRVTKIRDEAGVLHAVPNGEVRKVSSHSKGYVNAVVDIPVPYGENVHRVFALIQEKMKEVRASQPGIIEPTEIGIDDLRDSGMLLRTVTMCAPGQAKDLTDVIRLACLDALVAAKISAPYTRRLTLTADQVPAESSQPEARSSAVASRRSDIQRIKAHNLYLAMDVDENGFIEQADVNALGLRLLASQRRAPGSVVHARLQEALSAYWREIVRLVDSDQDGRISREEFLQFCLALPRDLSGPAGDSVRAMADALFTVCDRNETGSLAEDDFVRLGRAYGLSDLVAITGFKLIDRNGNGRISKEEWQRFMRDVFLSQKLNDAAAVVFGPGCRDQS